MNVRQQYVDVVRQSQEAWSGVVETITKNARAAFLQPTAAWGAPDPTEAVDQVFDFWKKTLDIQHGIAKQLVNAGVATGESLRDQAATLGDVVREQADYAFDAARNQAETLQDRANRKYDTLTKEQLQEELTKRNLPKSGTVEELRERLLADDQK